MFIVAVDKFKYILKYHKTTWILLIVMSLLNFIYIQPVYSLLSTIYQIIIGTLFYIVAFDLGRKEWFADGTIQMMENFNNAVEVEEVQWRCKKHWEYTKRNCPVCQREHDQKRRWSGRIDCTWYKDIYGKWINHGDVWYLWHKQAPANWEEKVTVCAINWEWRLKANDSNRYWLMSEMEQNNFYFRKTSK